MTTPAAPWPARSLRALARFVLHVFFRGIVVLGEEKIPRDRPLVLVANHVNGLIDPLPLFALLPRLPRFLAKSTLWKIPVLSTLLKAVGAIPVYRRQDAPASGDIVGSGKNDETFARCHEWLSQGGAIALFPEGTSHNEPALQPLKTGAARIALEAERRFGPLGVAIVPVGLHFEERGRFRSRALVQVGDPIDPIDPAYPAYPAYPTDPTDPTDLVNPIDPIREVRELTARIDAALHAVTLNYPSWEEARWIDRAAELFARPALEVPRTLPLAEAVDRHRAFLSGYAAMKARHPERVAALGQAIGDYDALLATVGLRDDQVAAAYPFSPVARFTGRTLVRLLVFLPVAAVGIALNLLPYRIVGAIAARSPDGDQKATMKVFPSLVVYPAGWLAAALLVAYGLGVRAGVLALLVALPTGYVAMLFDERRERFWREARAYWLLRTRRRVVAELKGRREAVYRELTAVVALYRSEESAPVRPAGMK